MYKAFYSMTSNPFSKNVPVEKLFISNDLRQFFARMEYFKTVKGFAVAYGRPGMGKTTSIRAFTSKLNPQLFKVVYLPLSALTVHEFYRNLAFGLGLTPGFKKVDMFHQIQDYIINAQHQKNQTPLIIIDEAQFLGGAILNELRMLFNFQMDSQNHAMILLCGQSSFVNQLNLHIHEPLRQRIMVKHEFKGIGPDEFGPFLTTLLSSAGVSEPIFTEDAIKAIANASNGSPRIACTLAEKSLIIGAQHKHSTVDANTVQDAYESTLIYETQGGGYAV